MASNVFDIEICIELTKRKIELELMLILTENSGEKEELAKNEIAKLSVEIAKHTEKLSKSGIRATLHNENAINDALQFVRNRKRAEVLESIKSKSGEIYDSAIIIKTLLKANHENKGEIAKINAIIPKLLLGKGQVEELLKKGDLSAALAAVGEEDKMKPVLARIFRRLGKEEGGEVPMMLNNKRVWVEKKSVDMVNENASKIKIFSTKMQIMAAEKQSGLFNEDKEKAFIDLQAEYLKLLKEQDELLKPFSEEIKIVSEFAT